MERVVLGNKFIQCLFRLCLKMLMGVLEEEAIVCKLF